MSDTTYMYVNSSSGTYDEDEFVSTLWLNQLKFVWTLWKKSEGVTRTLHEFFQTSPNPYISALRIICNCEDFKQAKPSSLTYTVMEELSIWVQGKENALSHLLTRNVKLEAFSIITEQYNMSLMKLVFSVYKMCEENHIFIDTIHHYISQKRFKIACQVASHLQLHEHFGIEDFLIPLILQDKCNVAEEFLSNSFPHQKQLVMFLDRMLGLRNVGNEVDLLITKYDIPDAKRSKMLHRPLSKLVGRLVKMYDLPRDCAPNLNNKRNEGALQFLVYKRYVQHTLGRDSFREMVLEAISANPDLKREVVVQLKMVGDIQEAAYWARELGLPCDQCPFQVQELLCSGSLDETAGSENWDENPGTEFLTLSLPDSHIVLVDNPVKFREFIHEVENADIVGIDSEWKPQFGTVKNELALIQVATRSKVYILDIVLIGTHGDCSWEEAGRRIFGNEQIIKIGFGVSNDLSMMLQCLPNLARTVNSRKGYLDLISLWKRLKKEFNFKFPYVSEEGNESLSVLVELCFGKRLDKSDQFSNWERRPLRESQITYAALDAFCLVEVFDILKENAERQEIPFRDICLELISKTKQDVKKVNKPRKNRRAPDVPTIVCPFEGPIFVSGFKVLCDKGLEGLGLQLRKVGVDTITLGPNDLPDRCVQIAKQDGRVVVVRGRISFARISQYVPLGYCYPVSSDTAHDQLVEVLKHFKVRVRQKDIFSRCKLCNGASFVKVSQSTIKLLKSAEKPSGSLQQDCGVDYSTGFSSESDGDSDDLLVPVAPILPVCQCAPTERWVENIDVNSCKTRTGAFIQLNAVPDESVDSILEYNICEVCGRIYWDGSHFERFLNGKLKDIICE